MSSGSQLGSVNVISELVCQKDIQEVSHEGLSVVQVANKNILRKELKNTPSTEFEAGSRRAVVRKRIILHSIKLPCIVFADTWSSFVYTLPSLGWKIGGLYYNQDSISLQEITRWFGRYCSRILPLSEFLHEIEPVDTIY